MCIKEFSKLLFPGQGKCALMVNKVGTVEIDNRLPVVFCSVISITSNTGMSYHTCVWFLLSKSMISLLLFQ